MRAVPCSHRGGQATRIASVALGPGARPLCSCHVMGSQPPLLRYGPCADTRGPGWDEKCFRDFSDAILLGKKEGTVPGPIRVPSVGPCPPAPSHTHPVDSRPGGLSEKCRTVANVLSTRTPPTSWTAQPRHSRSRGCATAWGYKWTADCETASLGSLDASQPRIAADRPYCHDANGLRRRRLAPVSRARARSVAISVRPRAGLSRDSLGPSCRDAILQPPPTHTRGLSSRARVGVAGCVRTKPFRIRWS